MRGLAVGSSDKCLCRCTSWGRRRFSALGVSEDEKIVLALYRSRVKGYVVAVDNFSELGGPLVVFELFLD